jgi:hypothetical protein
MEKRENAVIWKRKISIKIAFIFIAGGLKVEKEGEQGGWSFE